MDRLNQIRTQVSAIRQRYPEGRAVGIQFEEQWQAARTFAIAGTEQIIVQADSELAVREALSSTPHEKLVLLTNIPDQQLGEDVLARLAKRRLFRISSQEILRELFKAKDIEPRLAGLRWMADALADAQPAEGYPPVPGGRLDNETAWETLLRYALGFRSGKPDLLDLINWARRPESKQRLEALSAEAALGVQDWLKRHAGSAAVLVLGALRAANPAPIPALALACNVVFRSDQTPELIAAAARIEPLFGSVTPTPKDGQTLGETGIKWATRELEEKLTPQLRSELDAFDQLLKQLRIEQLAHLSDASQTGLEQRLTQLGDALLAFVSDPKPAGVRRAEKAFEAIRRHLLAEKEPERIHRAEMALRLCRWQCRTSNTTNKDFPAVANDYVEDGCFVDWARRHLFHGDSNSKLSTAYNQILKPIDGQREEQNHSFGTALVRWTENAADGLFHVEDIVPNIVVPLAKNQRVLLLVLDGMSLAIYQELMAAFSQYGLTQTVPTASSKPNFALAGLPTITEWSRKLLLVGRDQAITSITEETGFRDHPALATVSTPSTRPVLFLKGSLSERGGVGLSEEVRQAIQDKRPTVGIVVNAIDDHLLKCDQLHLGWSIERIPLLQQILAEATAANRIVVLTSDHGHVIDHDTETVRQEGSDRYRSNSGKPEPRELIVRGSRVAPFASGSFIGPWSERIIYTGRKNGYHGGISPQEVLVPIGVLVQEHNLPDGWQTVAQRLPEWWFEGAETPAITKPTPPAAPAVSQQFAGLPLLDPTANPRISAGENWIEALLKSSIFQAQLNLAGRVAPSTDTIRKTLESIDERGGSLLLAALASKTGIPEFRLPGMLASLRRILNIEGYPVLSIDDTSGTVRINRDLLKSQFDLTSP